MIRHLAPFAAAALLGFVLVPLHNPTDWSAYLLAAALTAAVAGAAVVSPRPTLPAAFRMALPLLFLVAVALLRDAGGGLASGVGGLALLPCSGCRRSATRSRPAWPSSTSTA
jgi:hypothetical protein